MIRELLSVAFWQTQLASSGGELLVKVTALLVAALLLNFLLRGAAAGVKHLLWATTICALLLLPLLSAVSPLRVPVLPSALAKAPRGVTVFEGQPGAQRAEGIAAVAPGSPAPHGAPVEADGAASAPVAELGGERRSLPSIPVLIALVWGFVALAFVARLAFGWMLVRRIAATGEELTSSDWTTPLWEAADRLDLPDVPRLLRSERASLPFACGIRKPMIVLPPEADAWSSDRRRAVLFHELAHVRRKDLVAHTLARLACALYWPHPLVWSASRRLRAESERACDDLVLASGTRASEYADHLLQIVTAARHSRAPAVALPMAQRREFEGRMLAILDPRERGRLPRVQAAVVSTGVLMLALLLAASAPASADAPSIVSTGDLPFADERPSAPESRPSGEGTARTAMRGAVSPSIAQPNRVPAVVGDTDVVGFGSGIAGAAAEIAQIATDATLQALGQLGISGEMADAISSARAEMNAEAQAKVQEHEQERPRVRERPGRPDARNPTRTGAEIDAPAASDPARSARETDLLLNVLGTNSAPSARRTAAWGLYRREGAGVSPALRQALLHDADESVREMAAWSLSFRTDPRNLEALASAATSDRSAEVRETAAWSLGHLRARGYAGALAPALQHSSPGTRLTAAWAIGQMRPRSAPPQLIGALNDSHADVQEAVAWALGEIRDPSAVPALLRALDADPRKGPREAIVRAIVLSSGTDHRMLEQLAASGHTDLSERALRSIARGGADSWPWPWPWPRPRPTP